MHSTLLYFTVLQQNIIFYLAGPNLWNWPLSKLLWDPFLACFTNFKAETPTPADSPRVTGVHSPHYWLPGLRGIIWKLRQICQLVVMEMRIRVFVSIATTHRQMRRLYINYFELLELPKFLEISTSSPFSMRHIIEVTTPLSYTLSYVARITQRSFLHLAPFKSVYNLP